MSPRHAASASRTEPRAPVKRTIDSLTGIRAVAAAWVVVEHFHSAIFGLAPATTAVRPWIVSGYLGVEVFFVLSGFIISYNYAEKLRRPSAVGSRGFFYLRLARIYPVHLLTVFLMGLLYLAATARHVHLNFAHVFTVGQFGLNVLMLQAVPPGTPWNGPSWSISCEFAAYLCFPLLAVVITRLGRASCLIAATVLVGTEIYLLSLFGTSTVVPATSYPVMWLRIAFEFTVGCLLWAAWRFGSRPSVRWDVLAIGSVVGAAALLDAVNPLGSMAFVVLPLLALFVVSCASVAGPVARVLGSRLLRWGGRISYSVYMTHFIIRLAADKLVPWTHFRHSSVVVRIGILVGYAVVVVAVGALFYRLIEEPARRFLRRTALSARRVRAEDRLTGTDERRVSVASVGELAPAESNAAVRDVRVKSQEI